MGAEAAAAYVEQAIWNPVWGARADHDKDMKPC